MSNATTLELPSSGLCDLVAALTEEGLELERRIFAWAKAAREEARCFDDEAAAANLDAVKYDRAAIRAGLGVLHAITERMLDSLGQVVCHAWDEEVTA